MMTEKNLVNAVSLDAVNEFQPNLTQILPIVGPRTHWLLKVTVQRSRSQEKKRICSLSCYKADGQEGGHPCGYGVQAGGSKFTVKWFAHLQ